MEDVIKRAEISLRHNATRQGGPERLLICDLITALKASRVENETLRAEAGMWRGVEQMFRAMEG